MINVTDTDVELSRKSEPQRTCIGCRGKGGRSVLLRIVCDENAVLVLDSRKAMPGRGAWLHADETCLSQATTRRAWGRALRLRSAVSTDARAEQVEREIRSTSYDDENTGRTRRGTSTTVTESGFDAMSTR